jgi:hypothetical protein
MKLALAVLLAAAVPALAEHGPEHKKEKHEMGDKKLDAKAMAAKKTQHMAEMLKLDDGQKKKVGAILESEYAEKEALMKKMRDLDRANHEKIRALLNDEQKEKLDMMRAKHGMRRGMMKEKFIRRMEKRGGPGGKEIEVEIEHHDGGDHDD